MTLYIHVQVHACLVEAPPICEMLVPTLPEYIFGVLNFINNYGSYDKWNVHYPHICKLSVSVVHVHVCLCVYSLRIICALKI